MPRTQRLGELKDLPESSAPEREARREELAELLARPSLAIEQRVGRPRPRARLPEDRSRSPLAKLAE